ASEESEDSLSLSRVIVTGTLAPKEAIRSSNAVSIFSAGRLEELNPQSVGELVLSIPGFHPEASGGDVGNNIAPRGFPLSTQTEFTALQRDGMTVFYNQDILFSQSDRFTRMSKFVESAEAVRGGSSSIFVGSAPAGYINFISREGGDTLEGDIQLETNSANRFGVDGWVSGPINDTTTFAIGAWYRADDSLRDPGFTANRGGGFNLNVKHDFANGRGFIKGEFNVQDDEAIFFLPQPLTGTTTDPATIPGGMDINDGTTGASANARFLRLNNTPNGDLNFDLQDGQSADVTYFGTKAQYELGEGWTVTNQNRYTDMFTTFNAIINVGNARSLTGIASEIFNSAPDRFAGAQGTDGTLFFEIRDTGTGILLANQDTADTLNTNGFGIDGGYFYRSVEGENFQNDLALQHTNDGFGGGVLNTTLGLFFSDIDAQVIDHRFDTLQTISPTPQRVDLIFTQVDGSAIVDDPTTAVFENGPGTFDGLLRGPDGFANVIYSETTFAPYIDFDWGVGAFDFNLGLRYETLDATGEVENAARFDLSDDGVRTDPGNPALTALPFGDGTFRSFDLTYEELAWTIAANYKVNDDLSVFARYASGFRMPDADRYQALASFDGTTADGAQAIIDFNNENRLETAPADTAIIEAGLKYRSRRLNAAVNYFFAEANDLFFNVPTVVDGAVVQRQAFRNARTHGVEGEFNINLTDAWSIDLTGTLQQPEFFDTPAAEAIDPGTGQTTFFDINGNLPVRTPELFYQARTSYEFDQFEFGDLKVFASVSGSGRRFADDANTAELSPYEIFNFGASLNLENGVYVIGEVRNAFNSEGLTEGDPRAGETVFGGTNTFNARVVNPRLVNLRLGYRF
ncbi:MAG: TonB-dependent receptor, partial [Pseudomonadota bacterium]